MKNVILFFFLSLFFLSCGKETVNSKTDRKQSGSYFLVDEETGSVISEIALTNNSYIACGVRNANYTNAVRDIEFKDQTQEFKLDSLKIIKQGDTRAYVRLYLISKVDENPGDNFESIQHTFLSNLLNRIEKLKNAQIINHHVVLDKGCSKIITGMWVYFEKEKEPTTKTDRKPEVMLPKPVPYNLNLRSTAEYTVD